MLNRINWRYAIGEVIIVIIGITIAFSLNSWAENRKNESLKKQYLESLLLDLKSEKGGLEENILAFNEKKKVINLLMPFLHGKQEGRDTVSMKIFRLAELVFFDPHDVTYNTLVNSGHFSLFSDFKLIKDIEQHYTRQESLLMDYDRQKKIHEKYFGDFVIYEVDFDKMRTGDFSFMDKRTLRNIIQSLFGTYHICIQSAKEGIKRVEALELKIKS